MILHKLLFKSDIFFSTAYREILNSQIIKRNNISNQRSSVISTFFETVHYYFDKILHKSCHRNLRHEAYMKGIYFHFAATALKFDHVVAYKN